MGSEALVAHGLDDFDAYNTVEIEISDNVKLIAWTRHRHTGGVNRCCVFTPRQPHMASIVRDCPEGMPASPGQMRSVR